MDAEARPPWREPMLWLLVAIPTVAVAALIGMVVIAAGPGSTDSSDPAVQRMSQVQTVDMQADAAAATARLSARLDVHGDTLLVMPLHGDFDRARPLRLVLRHPALEMEDRQLILQPAADGWRADAVLPRTHDWNLWLLPERGTWRLQGRLERGKTRALLQPALP